MSDATPPAKPSLYILDAMNFLFREFHALPPLTTTTGLQTGAIYGLCQMILRIEREQRPTHLCVVYDAPGDNFRNAIYPAYKAHRPPMPPELAALLSMVDLYDRPGKSAGRGFYVYEDGRRRGLWPGLSQLAHGTPAQTGVAVVERRLLLAQALEAARCLESGVLRGPGDGDVGAILGVGFAPNTGGPFAWLNRQDLIALVAECEALALVHGARYAPPTLLRAMAAEGRRFYAA